MKRRKTFYKKLILGELERHHTVSAKELSSIFPKVDFSTIYRNLRRLAEDGVVHEVNTGSDVVSYELSEESHDHFVCGSCEKVKEIKIDKSSLQKLLPKGYRINLGQNIIKGVCNKCK